MPIKKNVNKDFFKAWSREMAYIVGFFAADGYLTKNRRGAKSWNIQILDKNLLEEIQKAVGSDHKISLRPRSASRVGVVYRLQIGSKEMYDDLIKIGFSTRKTKHLRVLGVPKKFAPDFIRGYFDGDGNVWVGDINISRAHPTKVIQVSFTSCSLLFLKSLSNLLKDQGISGGSVFSLFGTGYSRLNLSVNDALKLYNIMYNKPHVLFLKRKKDVFEKFIKMRL